ncbi:MAG: phenylacetate-CoA oxygenase subunit PaaJ [Flavisolibacter sp.]
MSGGLRNQREEEKILDILRQVKDPEVPVLSVVDLGIIRSVEVKENILDASLQVDLVITPTYSGCPAMDTIRMDIRLKMIEHGYRKINILESLSPPWTTEWMSEEGKQKLRAYGIASPNSKPQFCQPEIFHQEALSCPLCQSYHTEVISQFGSTPCKALYKCLDCKEPFDYFKCH